MFKDKLIIIGASGHGKVVADIAMKMGKWKSISFLDDNHDVLKTSIGIKVIGKTTDAFKHKVEADFFVAIGNNLTRKVIQEKLEIENITVVKLIHPEAVIGVDVEIGSGTSVMAGVVINSSSRVGKGCIINTGSSLDHDNILGDFVHISPGVNLAGSVEIGSQSWIGVGSTVSNNIRLCNDCKVGAGAVVINDITVPGIYVGVPVRRL